MSHRKKGYAAGFQGRAAVNSIRKKGYAAGFQGRAAVNSIPPLLIVGRATTTRKDTFSVSNYLPVTHGTPAQLHVAGGTR